MAIYSMKNLVVVGLHRFNLNLLPSRMITCSPLASQLELAVSTITTLNMCANHQRLGREGLFSKQSYQEEVLLVAWRLQNIGSIGIAQSKYSPKSRPMGLQENWSSPSTCFNSRCRFSGKIR